MELFYTKNIDNGTAVLDEQESIHCTKVLRNKPGDIINFTDGIGNLYSGKLLATKGKEVAIEIIERKASQDSRPYYLHMAVALTKNYDRFEWFLEKAVEIGVDRVTPLVCDHSERRVFKYERAERLILSAAKQSLKTLFPVLDEIVKASDFIATVEASMNDCSLYSTSHKPLKIMGHCRKGEKIAITSILGEAKDAWIKKRDRESMHTNMVGIDLLRKPHIVIMIGPEGDFSVEEIELAINNDFKIMELGNSRMRVETAAVTAVTAVYLNYLESK